MKFMIELEQETDGRWIAEISAIPGCLAYGESGEEAALSVQALAVRILEDRKVNDGN